MTTLSFGETMRRLRRDRGWSLHKLADETGMSYTHLSRLENDSTLPNAETVAKLAEALDGDLGTMLKAANCLPRAILERIEAHARPGANQRLHRRANTQADAGDEDDILTDAIREQLITVGGLGAEAARQIANAATVMASLPSDRQEALAALILSLRKGDVDDGRG